jgi:signal transduction histidine kinase
LNQPSHDLIEARATAGAQERARLAREIHDGVAQDLAALGYRLDDLATTPNLASDQRSEIRQIRSALSETLQHLRRSIFDLRNSEIDLLTELRGILDELEGQGMEVSFVCDDSISDLSPAVARQLHAIAVEGFLNAAHHANATRLEFIFSNQLDSYQMTIQDNGVGNVEVKEFSYGLATMNERAKLIDATCIIENPTSGGTIIRISALHS